MIQCASALAPMIVHKSETAATELHMLNAWILQCNVSATSVHPLSSVQRLDIHHDQLS